MTIPELIASLGEPAPDNIYTLEADADGVWWLIHDAVGSGERLEDWLEEIR